MSDRELHINVYDGSKIGHSNVSFYWDGEHQYTIGANIRFNVPKLALPRILPFEPDDGIYRNESAYHNASIVEGTVKSASVPVTDLQYEALFEMARSLENETFNYSVFTEACLEFVEDFYAATGHPGEFGDLFAAEDQSGSLVWTRVPVSETPSSWPADQPLYSPPDPIMPDPPTWSGSPEIVGNPDRPIGAFDEWRAFEGPLAWSEFSASQSGRVDNGNEMPREGEAEPSSSTSAAPVPTDPQSGDPFEQANRSETPHSNPETTDPTIPFTADGREVSESPTGGEPIAGVSDSSKAPIEAQQEEEAGTLRPPPEEPPSLDPVTTYKDKQTHAIDPYLSEPGTLVFAFDDIVSSNEDAGQSMTARTRVIDSERRDQSDHLGVDQAAPTASSPGFGLRPSFDQRADAFDFHSSETTTELSFGPSFESSWSSDAFSDLNADLGFSFDGDPGIDDDSAADSHPYDEFGIFS